MSTLIILSFLLLLRGLHLHHAAIFEIINQCPYTIWAAAIPGGGQSLVSGQNWTINVNARMDEARIWARTGCTFNDSGHGNCQTGDCNGLLECQTYGTPPNTLARFTLNGFNNLDFIDISLAEGFNVPMEFSPTAGCDQRIISCAADIKGQCPTELQSPGGCNDPCTVFQTDEYCCNSARNAVGLSPVTWDTTVVAYAQNYANQRIGDCQLVHSGGPYGENIFWGSGAEFTAADAVNSWVSEKQYYDYASNTCAAGKVCGHYTQVVWKSSTSIGCAGVKCNNGAIFIICNYKPAGNIIGQRPY
ncbi:hypothetical protein J5N97_028466 [Dioscorea zingiberensis]|uniref:SCP domain-containing protein n=1 Tax=Dioscorea zingiberensis TaxID=325984 RepID=A0A9D5BZ96_9LILI|nr:hypothetical protein J5N97_028466 [Dioscorea zingiberensis]